MYETFFGLRQRPFSMGADPQFFAPVAETQKALDAIRRCVRGGQGIAVLTAPAGTGKTQLCHQLAAELKAEFATVFLVNSNFPSRASLLQAILHELGHPYIRMAEQELRLELNTAIKAVCAEQQGILLLVDESHLLNERLLEEIRTITNLTDAGAPVVRVVLSGQTPLEESLTRPELAAVNQRIGCQVSLQRLSRQESGDYVKSRLNRAGGDLDDIVTPDALHLIAYASDGIPRCLNQLCDHSLLLGFVRGVKPIDETIVREALEDLKQLPLHWNEPLPEAPMVAASQDDPASAGGAPSEGWSPVEEMFETEDSFSDPEDEEQAIPADGFAVEPVDVPAGETIETGSNEDTDASSALPNDPEFHVPTGSTEVIEVGAPEDADPPLTEQPSDSGSEAATFGEEQTVRSDEQSCDHHSCLDENSFLSGHSPEETEAPEQQFSEEVVVDRYAMLDAGRDIPAETHQTSSETTGGETAELSEHESKNETEPSANEDAEPSLDVRRIDERGVEESEDDVILVEPDESSLLLRETKPFASTADSAALWPSEPAFHEFAPDEQTPPQEPAEASSDDSQDISPVTQEAAGAAAEPVEQFGPATEEEDIETQISNAVFELCWEMQQAVMPPPAEPIGETTPKDSARQPLPEYDIVEPEPESHGEIPEWPFPSEDQQQTAETGPPTAEEDEFDAEVGPSQASRPYAQLFSQLRRRRAHVQARNQDGRH